LTAVGVVVGAARAAYGRCVARYADYLVDERISLWASDVWADDVWAGGALGGRAGAGDLEDAWGGDDRPVPPADDPTGPPADDGVGPS
jgi:hypothetical protein